MDEQKKKLLKQDGNLKSTNVKIKQNFGITLIALIVTIIIMVILAGVSMSAIIGDNGILSNAQKATYESSIAVLEEYFQEIYAMNYDKFENLANKLDGFLSDGNYRKYFYIPADHGYGLTRYIVDSEGHALYLIQKSGLPQEIQDQIQGGNAGEGTYNDYMQLNDVYGITTDLKVYYCESGLDTIMGLNPTNLDNDNPGRTVFTKDNNSTMYNFLNSLGCDRDGDGIIDAEECKLIKELTIKSDSGITDFKDFYNFVLLEKITIDGVNVKNLQGLGNCSRLAEIILNNLNLSSLDDIQNCQNLYYIYFKSSTVGDYSALAETNKLKYLYLYNINDDELVKLCNGIKNANLSKLNYLAVVGNKDYICNTYTYVCSSTKSVNTITSLEPLSTLSDTTKKAVRYLSIQNNNLSGDLNYIKDFTNLYLIRGEYNNLTSFDGIENMSKLNYICAVKNQLGTLSSGEGENGDNGTAIKALDGKSLVSDLNLEYNKNLTNVTWLKDNKNIKYLYLKGCSSSMDITSIEPILSKCYKYSLPDGIVYQKGGTTVEEETPESYKLSDYHDPSKVTYSELKSELYGNTKIYRLNLEGLTIEDQESKADEDKITNEKLNEILETMTDLQYLTLRNSTVLTSIDFIHGDDENADGYQTGVLDLVELDLIDTGVSGEESLMPLNDYAKTLEVLRISDGSGLKNICDTINRMEFWYYEEGMMWYESTGLICSNLETINELVKLEDVENLYIWSSSGSIYEGKSVDWNSVIDLSTMKHLCTLFIRGVSGNFVLPDDVGSLCVDERFIIKNSNLSNMTNLTIDFDKYESGDLDWISTVGGSESSCNVYVMGSSLDSIKTMVSSNSGIGALFWGYDDEFGQPFNNYCSSLEGIEKFVGLNEISIYTQSTKPIFNFSEVSLGSGGACPNLASIDISRLFGVAVGRYWLF